MSTLAGDWYSSGTFWTGAGVVVALLVGIATVAVSYLTRFARQRLDFGLRTVAPLLGALDGRAEVELLHHGTKLRRPHLAEVVLIGRGRRDIPRAAFDNGDPIRFDLTARVVELLEVKATDSASATPIPQARTEGSALLVGPALIGRRQRVVFRVLVEGRPYLRCEAPLPNAQVRYCTFDPRGFELRASRRLLVTVFMGLWGLSVLLGMAFFWITN
ncbi:hypothetical protein [Actinomadura montaniterrae]|uniref:Uncharacterized protein n=1 Tax=Actinomadura montaniterrae TaxID=1803903 RepID=A0A6L3VUG9_9ACTN|nr:hypothetical protein [Actinomadura montaniterrae]KAB2376959.1 hypothetical protein F9B16_24290 [Actinomadura montaniterrae]